MHVFNLRRAQCALVASVALLGVVGCTDSNGGPGPFNGLVTALRDAHQSSEGTTPASPKAADPAPAVTASQSAPAAKPAAAQPAAAQPAPAPQLVAAAAPVPAAKPAALPAKPATTAPADLAAMQHQLDQLESRVAELTAENQRQMERLSLMTNGAISDMEQLFNSLRLELHSAPGSEPAAPPLKRRKVMPPAANQAVPSGQGGPFLPWPPKPTIGGLSANDRVEPLLPDLKTLFLLHQVVAALPLASPLDEAVVTGPFGYRRDPFNRRSAFHDGIDLQAPMRSPIHAAAAGTVVVAGVRPAYGRVVEIDHGFGIHTRYAHLSAINVTEGEHVDRHALIGALGSSGRSASPHLHYEVLFNGRPHDPADLLVLAQGIRSLR
jgi:murein DD-endopeptidase MepM/ murein hydrolase activator NlpD